MADPTTDGTVVTAPPPTPPPQPTPQTTSATIPDGSAPQAAPASSMQAPAAPAPPPKKPEGWGEKVYHSVLGALGGTDDITLSRDPDTGKMTASKVKSTPGTQWKRIIAGAMAGIGNMGDVGTGPGRMGRALSAGIQGGSRAAQQNKARATQEADVDYDTQQKAKVQHAQMLMIGAQTANETLRGTRMKLDGSWIDATREQEWLDNITEKGGQDLGTAASFEDVLKKHQNDPSLMKAWSENQIRVVPSKPNPDGTYSGLHFAKVSPQYDDTPITKDMPMRELVAPSKPGEPPTIRVHTIDAGTMKQGDYDLKSAKKELDIQQAFNSYNETALKKQEAETREKVATSEIGKNWAEKRKANAEAKLAENQAGGDDIESQADQLAHNRMAVSQMSKRSGSKGNYNQILALADKITMQETGQHFSPEKNEIAYRQQQEMIKDATTGETSQTIVSFDKFMGHALDASRAVNDLRNTSIPWVNTPMNKLAVGAGTKNSPAVVSFLAQAETVRTEFETLLKNNHALTVEDKKSGETILDHNASPAQLQAALKSMAHISATRLRATNFGFKRVMHEDLPDLISPEGATALQHFGIDPRSVYGQAGQSQAPPVVTPANAVSEIHNPAGQLTGWRLKDGTIKNVGQP